MGESGKTKLIGDVIRFSAFSKFFNQRIDN